MRIEHIIRTRTSRLGTLMTLLTTLGPSCALAQRSAAQPVPSPSVVTLEQPDAQRTKNELERLLEHYPPGLRGVLALDPTLLNNQSYLAPYPGLVTFLTAHPEVARNASFYIGDYRRSNQEHVSPGLEIWRDVMQGLGVFGGFGMAIALLVWL